jgi:hypothetical protein
MLMKQIDRRDVKVKQVSLRRNHAKFDGNILNYTLLLFEIKRRSEPWCLMLYI